jgi:hypothetical protein
VIPASKVSGSNVAFDRVLDKAIHPDPAQRYHTVGEMSAALEELIVKFEKTPGLLTLGSKPNRSKVLGGIPMAGGITVSAGKPVATSSQSGGNIGLIIGLIVALMVGVIVIASTSEEDDEPKGASVAEQKAQLLQEQKEILAAEEKRMAEVAKKKRKARELEEEQRRREEKREARRLEREEGEKAVAEQELRKEQLRIEEEERKRAIAEAEAQKSNEKVPVYNHEGFIARERADISVRAATVIRDHKEETDEILDREERDAKRAARRSAEDGFSDLLEARVEDFFKQWKESGDLPVFPEDTPERVTTSLKEFIAEIKAVDTKRLNKLSRYQDSYAKELQKMSQLLEKENVIASVSAIQAELAALTKTGYFLAIVKSEDPKPDTFEVELEEEEGLKFEGEKKGKDNKKKKK